jgi:hypothetical protein
VNWQAPVPLFRTAAGLTHQLSPSGKNAEISLVDPL